MDQIESPAVYALLKLHAELGGRINDNKREAAKLRANMKHVEAVLHLLKPDFNARRIAARRKNNPNPLFRRGTIFRAVLEALREAPEPMTADELVTALFQSKGIQEPSRDERRRMYGAVNSSLGNHEGKTVEATGVHPRRWRIIR